MDVARNKSAPWAVPTWSKLKFILCVEYNSKSLQLCCNKKDFHEKINVSIIFSAAVFKKFTLDKRLFCKFWKSLEMPNRSKTY